MISFELSDDQKQLQELARKFAKEEMAPKAEHHDHTGEFPYEVTKKAWELGLMNTHIPQELEITSILVRVQKFMDRCVLEIIASLVPTPL